jgi:hypothetical protein
LAQLSTGTTDSADIQERVDLEVAKKLEEVQSQYEEQFRIQVQQAVQQYPL